MLGKTILDMCNTMEKMGVALTGIKIRVIRISQNEGIGYSIRNKNEALIGLAFDYNFEGISENEKKIILFGVYAHEIMHIIRTGFEYEQKSLGKYSKMEGVERHKIANICEDPAIEYFADVEISEFLCRCLRQSIRYFYKAGYTINDPIIKTAYMQWMTAMIQFGDVGLIKGSFTYPEAKTAFKKTSEILIRLIEEPLYEKRFEMSQEIFDIIKPLWMDHLNQAMPMSMIEELMNRLGKGNSSGNASAISDMDGDGGNRVTQRRKKTLHLLTKEELKDQQTSQNDVNSNATSVDGASDLYSAVDDDNPKQTDTSVNLSDIDHIEISDKAKELLKDHKDEDDTVEPKNSDIPTKIDKGDNSAEEESDKQTKGIGQNNSDQNVPDDKGVTKQSGTNKENDKENGGKTEAGSTSEGNHSVSDNMENGSINTDDKEVLNNNVGKVDLANSQTSDVKKNNISTDENKTIEQSKSLSDDIKNGEEKNSPISKDDLLGDEIKAFEAEEEDILELSKEIKEILDIVKNDNKASAKEMQDSTPMFDKESDLRIEVRSPYFKRPSYTIRNVNVRNAVMYDQIKINMKVHILNLRSQLRKVLKEDRKKRDYRTNGKLNIPRVCGRKLTARMFTKKAAPSTKMDMAIEIMIDQSGSMCTHVDKVKKTIVLLMEAFSEFDIPIKIVGFTSIGGQDAHYNHFNGWKNNKAARETVVNLDTRGGTFLGHAIRYGGELLNKRPEQHKIYIIITDGDPEWNGYKDKNNGMNDCRYAVRDIQKFADVIGIGVYSSEKQEENFKFIFKDSCVSMADLSSLVKELPKKVRKIIETY